MLEGTIRPGPQPESRSTVRHVDAERGAGLEHVFQVVEITLLIAEVMRRAPGVEPAGIKFAAHQRALRKDFPQRREARSGIGPKVHNRKQIDAVTVLEMIWWIARKQRHIES